MDYSRKIAKLSEWIKNQESLYTELQTLLVGCPAVGPESDGDGEWQKAEALKEWLSGHNLYPDAEYHSDDKRVSSGRRPNFSLRLPGASSERRIWVMTHLDVVPPGELAAWKHDPFSATVKQGRVYGRGSEDNHQGLIMSLLGLLAFRQNGIVPPFDLHLLFVSDEEVSSAHGISHVLAKDGFKPGDCFLVPDGGDPEGMKIEIAEKSILWIKFTLKGVQCHASEPEKGKNAFLAGSALVLALQELKQLFPGRDSLFSPPGSTFEPTRKTENQPNINTIPGEDVFYMDCRILPDIKRRDVEKEVKRICAEVGSEYDVSVSYGIADSTFSGRTDPDHPLVQAMRQAVLQTRGREARLCGFGGGTVAAWLRRKGYPAIVWSSLAGMAHMPDEYSVIANALADTETFCAFVLNFADQDSSRL